MNNKTDGQTNDELGATPTAPPSGPLLDASTDASHALYQRARRVLTGGSTRLTTYHAPHPLYAVRGSGAMVVDVDGTERVDFLNNYMTLIHGHAHPEIVAAVTEQASRGTCFGMPTEGEIVLAESICERVGSVEQIRFCNSGTEAVMLSVKAARAFTGRPMVAKCEGAYHGAYDPVEVSLNSSPENWGQASAPARVPYTHGTSPGTLADVLVLPYNDVEQSRALLEQHAHELAAVLVDPVPPRVGFIPMGQAYAQMLREFASENGSVLIFDEVASFRVGYGGAQSLFEVTPDLTTFGKIIGGGLPVGAVGGRADVMAVFDPSSGAPRAAHGGTFNGNPMTMAAGAASMRLLTVPVLDDINALGEHARTALNQAFERAGVEGQASGVGSFVKLHGHKRALHNYRDVYSSPREGQILAAIHRGLLERGFIVGSAGLMALSSANTKAQVDAMAHALEALLVDLRLNEPSSSESALNE
ncbi:MAG: glutamate-1-semialdehyde 2,1-aminomutase [Gammaproteobacteria bacterium]